jgi:predicted transposase YbfD/YdcC
MDESLFFNLINHFSEVEDPRMDRTKKHNVIDIISITVMGTISGMQNWIEIVDWAETNEEWLKTFLELPGGVPSHDTFGRVFSLINPESFQEAFKSWVESMKINFPEREIIAIDGKFLNGSILNSNSRSSLTIVSAWACKSGLSLGQLSSRLKKEEGEKRTMEKLIDQIDVRGNIITIDANGATTTIIEKISSKGGDCVVGLKDNQRRAKRLAANLFAHEKSQTFRKIVVTEDHGHGRDEKRTYELLELDSLNIIGLQGAVKKFNSKWPNIASFGRVISERKIGKEITKYERFFLTSLKDENEFAESVRSHWKIENSLHWQLDVTFREDYCRARMGHAAENLAIIRRLALNLLKQDTSEKKSIRRKQLLCNWNKNYLLQITMGI